MSQTSKPRRQLSRGATRANNAQPSSPGISDALRSWIENVIAPALVKAYLAEQALRKGEVRA
jgi:hypothetical protein